MVMWASGLAIRHSSCISRNVLDMFQQMRQQKFIEVIALKRQTLINFHCHIKTAFFWILM